MTIRLVFAFICSLIFLSGCSLQLKPSAVEDVALVSLIGIDYEDENNMSVTLAVPQYSSSAGKKNQVYNNQASMINEAIVNISSQADKEIKFNGLRVVLFNEEFAKSGRMWEVVEHFYRNPVVSGNVYVVIVKDSAEELLRGEYPDKPSIVSYLTALLKPKPNIMNSPITTIHNFMYAHSNPVLDVKVPYLEDKGDFIEISGTGLFNKDKLEEVYSREKARIIQLLSGEKRLPAVKIQLSENGEEREEVVIDLITSEVDYSSNKNVDHPLLDISVKLKGSVYEYRGEKDLLNSKDFSLLEEEISKITEQQVEQVINELLEKKIDPIGFSENFRMYYHGEWTEEKSREVLGNLEYTVSTDMQILATGTLR
ncbi:Ger(x)C family spore germination protein [Jeotgalibacillus campisalis]|uniref:Spore germination protein n=1 Tax=Jeotgalibacillus campisalis TaxID=220754 RepID=A0A0C2W583_9BACL|nr:Ger(x)C family spore germination protein [Jeotgalibacillus campisalis]KIL51183.1 hypothetical protein KR50_10640 [Jeotgalibacillus campisalis]